MNRLPGLEKVDLLTVIEVIFSRLHVRNKTGFIIGMSVVYALGMSGIDPVALRAQQRRALAVEDALSARVFGEYAPIAFSPDSQRLFYLIRDRKRGLNTEKSIRGGIPWNGTDAQIYVTDVVTNQTKNVTAGIGSNWFPVWSPDGRFLAFLSDRGGNGKVHLWLWEASQDRLREIPGESLHGDSLQWTPDGQRILVSVRSFFPAAEPIEDRCHDTASGSDCDREPESTVTLYHSPYGSGTSDAPRSDPWALDQYLHSLILIDIASGQISPVVSNRRIAKYALSRDGSRVAYSSPTSFERTGSQQTLFNLVVINLQTARESIVASSIRFSFDGASFNWSPDGRRIGFRTYGAEEKSFDCYVVDMGGGKPRDITNFVRGSAPLPHRSTPPMWDADSAQLYFVDDGTLWRSSISTGKSEQLVKLPSRNITALLENSDNGLWIPDQGESTVVIARDKVGRQDGFYKIDLRSEQATVLLESNQCYTCGLQDRFAAGSPDGRLIAYYSEDAQHDSDLWLTDLDFRKRRRLTVMNPQFDQYEMGASRLVDWLSDDGERLHGALLLPPGYDGGRLPLIVWVYGGLSLSDYVNTFGLTDKGPFNAQILATRGYAVLLPDAPLHIGTPMLDLTKDILPGVNRLIDMDIVDPGRLGLIGRSFGGFCTLALLVQTKRFKAAIDIDGFGDLVGASGQMGADGGAFLATIAEHGGPSMGGTLWEHRARYIENSPIFYFDRVETPLLIIHGSEDTSVAPFLGDEVFLGLRRLGKEAEYAKYTGEDHAPPYWQYQNQVDVCKRILRWLSVHLDGGH